LARKPENTYIARVHRHLDEAVYREKTNNPYRGGTPDVLYEGNKDNLWIEYKWFDTLPPLVELVDKKLSRLQQSWLRRCHGNERPCAVIVGCPSGGIIYPGTSWEIPIPRETFLNNVLTAQEVAAWITNQVTR